MFDQYGPGTRHVFCYTRPYLEYLVILEFEWNFSLIFRFYVSFQSFQPCCLILQNLWICVSDVLQAVEVKVIKYVCGKLHMGILKETEKRESVPVAVSSL